MSSRTSVVRASDDDERKRNWCGDSGYCVDKWMVIVSDNDGDNDSDL